MSALKQSLSLIMTQQTGSHTTFPYVHIYKSEFSLERRQMIFPNFSINILVQAFQTSGFAHSL
jgi:hypothetical protein